MRSCRLIFPNLWCKQCDDFLHSTEGEIAVYYDHIRAMQENLLRDPLDKLLKLVQLHLFGQRTPRRLYRARPNQ
ncbi:anti-CBASS protein Acb1 family protein [Neisseria sicca]|uniref:anti-CBASS protein Acb1 family protein n=1 Tax=Neisseria sicca TaxID=490 RepID=UPI002880801E|nr:anti-CBASS Acb1 family protein [Neisseria sicca]